MVTSILKIIITNHNHIDSPDQEVTQTTLGQKPTKASSKKENTWSISHTFVRPLLPTSENGQPFINRTYLDKERRVINKRIQVTILTESPFVMGPLDADFQMFRLDLKFSSDNDTFCSYVLFQHFGF